MVKQKAQAAADRSRLERDLTAIQDGQPNDRAALMSLMLQLSSSRRRDSVVWTFQPASNAG